MKRFPRLPAAAFTLIELLVVMGLIAILAAGVGLALQGGDRSVALQAAQGTLASLLTSARGQAALAGRNAALVVQADPGSPDSYLRAVTVAVRDTADTTWVPVDDWVLLPPNAYFLPATVPDGALIVPGDDWSGLRSSAFAPALDSCDGIPCLVLSFTPRGTISGGGDLVLAPAVRQPAGAAVSIQFIRPDAVRGVVLSTYGIATLIDDRSGF